jgi:nuclear transcription factor Y gamma
MFILEMTLRSWAHAEENRRRTLQRSDVAAAISRNEIFDFLVSLSTVWHATACAPTALPEN